MKERVADAVGPREGAADQQSIGFNRIVAD